MAERRKLVIDCDPGNDDAMAIFMALADPDIDVIAITCVEGNTNVKQTGLNVLRTLKAADRLDIPVYLGCNSSLLGPLRTLDPSSCYHGNDGLGDVPDKEAPGEDMLQTEHGVTTLLRLSREHTGNLHLVAMGPLTNIAMATRLDPNFGKRLVSCSIMGGNYLGRGNVTMSAEFNFYYDPEAAYVVLTQLGCPLLIVPWETCLQHGVSWEYYFDSRNLGTPKSQFMKFIDGKVVAQTQKLSTELFETADEALMACFLNGDVIVKSTHVFATVELGGSHTTGQMVVDWNGHLKKEKNVTIVTDMDQTLYENMMFKALQ